MHREYASGIPHPEVIAPEGYTLDAALLARPGNVDIQLDIFLDYANNVKLYPKLQNISRNGSRAYERFAASTIRISLQPERKLFGVITRMQRLNFSIRATSRWKGTSRRLQMQSKSFSQPIEILSVRMNARFPAAKVWFATGSRKRPGP